MFSYLNSHAINEVVPAIHQVSWILNNRKYYINEIKFSLEENYINPDRLDLDSKRKTLTEEILKEIETKFSPIHKLSEEQVNSLTTSLLNSLRDIYQNRFNLNKERGEQNLTKLQEITPESYSNRNLSQELIKKKEEPQSYGILEYGGIVEIKKISSVEDINFPFAIDPNFMLSKPVIVHSIPKETYENLNAKIKRRYSELTDEDNEKLNEVSGRAFTIENKKYIIFRDPDFK